MLFVCVGPQAPARLLFDYYGQYHLTTIAYTCVTQQVIPSLPDFKFKRKESTKMLFQKLYDQDCLLW